MRFLTASLLCLLPLSFAQSSSSSVTTTTSSTSTEALVAPTLAPSGVSPGAGTKGYTYAGCWNETTGVAGAGGVRALNGGSMESVSQASSATCISFCAQSNYQYCGIEFGRECWGATYLSPFSEKLDDSKCNYECEGNGTEICGGSLTITLFNLTSSAKTSAAARGEVRWGVLGVLGLVGGMSLGFIGL